MARALTARAAPLAAALIVGFVAGEVSGAARASDATYGALDVFARVLAQIDASYVEPLPPRELVYRALDGMDDALDPHSRFLDPESFQRLRDEAEGQFVGIGTQLREDPCGLRLSAVIEGGPADRAGLVAGDCIIRIDGATVRGLELDDALARVRGREGEAVTLGVLHGGSERIVPVLRTRFVEPAVEGALFSEGLAWLRIRQFRSGAAEEIAAEVAALGGAAGLRGAVLDLRENPGGRLDEAVATADLFLSEGRIVSTRGRDPAAPAETHDATPARSDWAWPLVVLVDGQSASAAEIVAGALQDRGRAVLVGSATYGKGSVQTVYAYEDGSALKLTIARYYLPSGRAIADREGLRPDILTAPATLPSGVELLRGRISTVNGLDEATRRELLELASRIPETRLEAPIPRKGTLTERLAKDPPLAAAWRALRERVGSR